MSLLAAPLAAADAAEAIRKMGAELVFLLESAGIPQDIIAKFGDLGYSDVDTFANMEVDAKEVRKMLKDDVGLDPAGGPQHRSMTARLVSAWSSAGTRSAKLKEEEATQRAGDLPRHMTKAKHLELTRAYQAAHRELRDRERPAPAYLDWRLEQVEDGELKAESLAEVINKEEAQDDDWGGARVNPDGSIRLIKARSTGKSPDSPEGLREKIKLMGVAWEYVRLRYPARPYLANLGPQDWSDHLEWLLGEDVYQYVVRDASNTISYRPSWATIIELDYRVRKLAYKLVNEGSATLKTALVTARSDTALFQRYFLSPVSLAAGAEAAKATSSKRPAPTDGHRGQPPPAHRPTDGSLAPPAQVPPPPASFGKGRGRGRGRGGKGNKGSQANQSAVRNKKGEMTRTPDGRLICFAYQRGNCNGQCGKVHICTICGDKHPKKDHPSRPSGGDAAGRPTFQ